MVIAATMKVFRHSHFPIVSTFIFLHHRSRLHRLCCSLTGAREGAPRKDKETDAPVEVGTNPEDINAETQRILRGNIASARVFFIQSRFFSLPTFIHIFFKMQRLRPRIG